MTNNYTWADAHKRFGKYTVTVEIDDGCSRADVYKNDSEYVNLTVADNDIRFDISPTMYIQMTKWANPKGW